MVEVSGLIKLSCKLSLFKAEVGGNLQLSCSRYFAVSSKSERLQQDMENSQGWADLAVAA